MPFARTVGGETRDEVMERVPKVQSIKELKAREQQAHITNRKDGQPQGDTDTNRIRNLSVQLHPARSVGVRGDSMK